MENIFGQRLKELRQSNGLTCEEFGKKMGVSKVSEWQWENSINYPNQDTIIRIANYFNVSIDYLLGVSDNPRPDVQLDEFQVALYNGTEELTDEQKEDLLQYVDYLKSKKKK